MARKFDLNLIETAPALVPLTITGKDQPWYEQLSGSSIFCRVWNDRISFEENILFTHWGLSGPAILQISSYWRPGESIYIDLLPNQNIADLIQQEKEANGKKMLLAYLASLYTRKFAEALSDKLPVEKNLASLTKTDIENISALIHEFKVKPAGDKGYDKAEVMRGGLSTDELSSKTLEVKKNTRPLLWRRMCRRNRLARWLQLPMGLGLWFCDCTRAIESGYKSKESRFINYVICEERSNRT